jgi:hypothetical protein
MHDTDASAWLLWAIFFDHRRSKRFCLLSSGDGGLN